jgi:hypothetical protein
MKKWPTSLPAVPIIAHPRPQPGRHRPFESFANVLAEMFERFVPEVEAFAKRTHDTVSVADSISRDGASVAKLKQGLDFNATYANEVAADRASEAFKADSTLIANCLADLQLATFGKWTAEMVYVKSFDREIESPGSASLSKIAELARTGGLSRAINASICFLPQQDQWIAI